MSETDKPDGASGAGTGADTGADDVLDAEIVEDTALVPAAPVPNLEPDYTAGGVPTFDYVRDRIEGRATTAAGATELAGLGTENDVATWDKKLADRDKAGRDKLEEIRRQMRGE